MDYKFELEKKARNYFEAIVANNTSILDPVLYSIENFEWACLTLDSRLIYVNFEAFLIPMVDFANYGETPNVSVPKTSKPKFNEEYTSADFKVLTNVEKNSQIFSNNGYSGDYYLLHHGLSIPDSKHNCFSISLSFTDRQDDPLRENKKAFFASYFLYDNNHNDNL